MPLTLFGKEVKEGPIERTRSTDAYVRTVYFDNPEDMEWLRNFRSMISIKNSFNRKYGLSRKYVKQLTQDGRWTGRFVYTRIKVSANGRLGKNNPNASKYRGRYNYRVKLKDAERADIYVHTVTDYPYGNRCA